MELKRSRRIGAMKGVPLIGRPSGPGDLRGGRVLRTDVSSVRVTGAVRATISAAEICGRDKGARKEEIAVEDEAGAAYREE